MSDPKPPPLVRTPARDFTKPKTATPPGGYPTFPPRQDDVAIVPSDFSARGDITGVHKNDPIAEIVARTERTQRLTEGVGANTLSIGARITAVEGDVKIVKTQLDGQDRELALIKTGVSTTNRLLDKVVDIASDKVKTQHIIARTELELDAEYAKDQLDAGKQKRERITISIRTAAAVVVGLLGSAGIGAAIHAWLSGAH